MIRHATHSVGFKLGRDVAVINAMLHVIIEEKLYDAQYIQANVNGFEALKDKMRGFSPEAMENISGVKAELLRDIARTYAT